MKKQSPNRSESKKRKNSKTPPGEPPKRTTTAMESPDNATRHSPTAHLTGLHGSPAVFQSDQAAPQIFPTWPMYPNQVNSPPPGGFWAMAPGASMPGQPLSIPIGARHLYGPPVYGHTGSTLPMTVPDNINNSECPPTTLQCAIDQPVPLYIVEMPWLGSTGMSH